MNGTLTANGFLYTTAKEIVDGGDITSTEGTGTVVLSSGAGTATTTYQATQADTDITYVEIPITSAKLHNGDGSYTTTAGAAAGTTYYWCTTCAEKGKWETVHTFYTVTFDSKEGTAVASQTVQCGLTFSKPADPTKADYTFAGWYKDETYTNAWDFDTDVVTGDITLYAKWEAEVVYSVTVSWGSMSYEYQPAVYTWNPENLQYSVGTPASWKAEGTSDNGLAAGTIQVKNDSHLGNNTQSAKTSVNAAFSFAKNTGYDWAGMTFTNDSVTIPGTYTGQSAGENIATVSAMLTGKPETSFSDATVGTITVTLSVAST